MASPRLTNVLLSVIAFALILIAARLYAPIFEPRTALAQPRSATSSDLIPVAIYAKYAGTGSWYPVDIDSDSILRVRFVR